MTSARCSFCGKTRTQVNHLVHGPAGASICDECARLAVDIAGEAGPEVQGGDLLLEDVGRLVTNDRRAADLVGVIEGAAVAVREGRVTWVGPASELPGRYRELPALACGGRTVIPGFVDPHTHLVFAGERSEELGRRLRGESYEDILAAGGGIQSTVAATRAAGPDRLLAESIERAGRMLAAGTTTVEIKSGYGLEPLSELHMLEVAHTISETLPLDVVTTFLGAHVVPLDYRDDRDGYLWLLESEMLPACAPLATYVDVFCDRGAFTVDEARRVLAAGRRRGLRPRLHANQLGDTGGVELAVEVGAVSADHVEHVSAAQAAALAEAGTVAVLLPAASLSLRGRRAPARMLWDEGVTVALATDCNPGTAYVERMPFAVALAAFELGLTAEEALWAATRGGALALEASDKGWIRPGAPADLVVLDTDTYLDLVYRPDLDHTWKVVKDGAVVIG